MGIIGFQVDRWAYIGFQVDILAYIGFQVDRCAYIGFQVDRWASIGFQVDMRPWKRGPSIPYPFNHFEKISHILEINMANIPKIQKALFPQYP